MSRLALFFMLVGWLATVGCQRAEEQRAATKPTVEPTPVEIETKPLLAVVENVARQHSVFQLYTSGSTSLLIRSAYADVLPPTQNPPAHWLGVDVELQSNGQATAQLELPQIELCDERELKSLAMPLAVQRLTDDARAAADDDPAFAGQNHFRCLLLYRVKELPTGVVLKAKGEALNATALKLEKSLFTLPQPVCVPLGWVSRPTSDPRYESCLALVECRGWSRVASPGRLKLRCLKYQMGFTAEPEAFVETDAKGRLLESLTWAQPYYMSQRWFLIDFWYPKGSIVVDLISPDLATAHMPNPQTSPFPEATINAIDAAPRFELSRHRREP
jgi:hypothetical protein